MQNHFEPTAWLGQSMDASSICAAYPELNQRPFITSLGCAIRRPSLKRTHLNSQLRHKLGLNGPLMVDSGGFALMANPGAKWTVKDVARAIAAVEAEIFVSLDYPPTKNDSHRERRLKIARSNERFGVLSAEYPHKVIMPVIHGCNLSEVEFAVSLLIQQHRKLPWVGFGGIVPLLQKRGPEVFIAGSLRILREAYPEARIHVFGAAGTSTFPAMFAFGGDSADSIGWRQAAGFGSIFLPLKTQRAIRWNKVTGPPRKTLDAADLAELDLCGCPVCRTAGSLQRKIYYLRRNFHNRSIHNAWVISNQTSHWPSTRGEMHSLIASGYFGPHWKKAAENIPHL
jgi:queuine/archaeosine tRNA-ribosyltransferase